MTGAEITDGGIKHREQGVMSPLWHHRQHPEPGKHSLRCEAGGQPWTSGRFVIAGQEVKFLVVQRFT